MCIRDRERAVPFQRERVSPFKEGAYPDRETAVSYTHLDVYKRQDGMEPTQLKENLEVVLESVFEYLYQEREKCGLIMRYRGSVSSGKGLVESIFVKYLNAFPNTFNEASVEFQVQFYYCTTGAMGIVRYWMEHDFKESPKRMAALTAKLLTKGIQGALEEAGRG